MARDTLSPEHQEFLKAFFEYRGNVAKASDACGYATTYGYSLARKLRDEIIEEANYILALGAAQAAQALVDGVDADKPAPASANRIVCAKEILDRVGIAKKDKVEITSMTAVPLFILPPKKDEPDPTES